MVILEEGILVSTPRVIGNFPRRATDFLDKSEPTTSCAEQKSKTPSQDANSEIMRTTNNTQTSVNKG